LSRSQTDIAIAILFPRPFKDILIKFTMSRKNLTELFIGDALRINMKWKPKLGVDDDINASLVNHRELRVRMKRYDLPYSKGQWIIKRFNLKCVIGVWSGA